MKIPFFNIASIYDDNLKNKYVDIFIKQLRNADFILGNELKEFEINIAKYLNSKNFNLEFILIPGCWTKDSYLNYLYDNIHWRFCGGFFIGDKNTLLKFYNFYLTYFPEFIFKYNKLVWEVNFWTWLESEKHFKFDWFKADHDDSMCILPSNFIY
jgi:hypothetical protein